jgi:hypothetical protein
MTWRAISGRPWCEECTDGLRKALAVEFDTFYNVERRDPKQGKQHWWINATEYVSYNDNHLGRGGAGRHYQSPC